MGVPLIAVTGGTVIRVSTNRNAPEGYSISIQSTLRDPVTNELLIFTYSHMRDRPLLVQWQTVTRGQMVGRVGNTGDVQSTGHLHFEVSNSGGVWTPQGPANASLNLRTWYRASYRVNPIFFYPIGTFTGDTSIWNEVRGARPAN